MDVEKFTDIPRETIEEALSLIDKGLSNYEITQVLGLNNYYLRKIRREHGRPPSQGNKNHGVYTEEQKQQMIELLREGNTVHEISRITGVKKQTLRNWRMKEVEKGNNLPIFEKATLPPPPPKTKYQDEEIIELVILNPGFGLERMLKILYPKSKSIRKQRFRITLLLNDYKEFFGDDLYELIQSPDYSTMVTENEYLRITGKNIPRGHGRRGGRNRGGKRINRNVKHKDTMIPLPPQGFNWGPYELRN